MRRGRAILPDRGAHISPPSQSLTTLSLPHSRWPAYLSIQLHTPHVVERDAEKCVSRIRKRSGVLSWRGLGKLGIERIENDDYALSVYQYYLYLDIIVELFHCWFVIL